MLEKIKIIVILILFSFSLTGCDLPLRIKAFLNPPKEELTEEASGKNLDSSPSPKPEEPGTKIEPEASTDILIAQIKQAFSEKYDHPVSAVNLTISEEYDNHAHGGVNFEGEIGGGWWLAAKVSGKWILVADGNGTVNCSDIEPYGFSSDMVPECWDEARGELRIRAADE